LSTITYTAVNNISPPLKLGFYVFILPQPLSFSGLRRRLVIEDAVVVMQQVLGLLLFSDG